METVTLEELWSRAEVRLRSVPGAGTPEFDEALRNKGERRTPEKRELLRRMAERARAAGLEPIKAHIGESIRPEPG